MLIIPPTRQSCWRYIGFTPSLHPSVCASVCPSCIPCPLWRTYSFGCIYFIFTHLIKQLQKMSSMWCCLHNFNIKIFGNFFKFVTLTLSCFVVLTWDLIWITSMGDHGVAGVSQNAGVLDVLVFILYWWIIENPNIFLFSKVMSGQQSLTLWMMKNIQQNSLCIQHCRSSSLPRFISCHPELKSATTDTD